MLQRQVIQSVAAVLPIGHVPGHEHLEPLVVFRFQKMNHLVNHDVLEALKPSERAGEACHFGSPLFQVGEITNRLMCGLFQFDTEMTHPILETFPDVLHLSGIGHSESIWLTVMSIDLEMAKTDGCGGRIVDKLTEVLTLQLLSRYIIEHKEASGVDTTSAV